MSIEDQNIGAAIREQRIAELPADAETPAVDQSGPTSEGAVKFLKMMDQIRQGYEDLRVKLTGDQLYDALVAGLSSHPHFIALTRNLVKETLAEHIAEQTHDHGEARELTDNPEVKGYIAKLTTQREKDSHMKLCLLSSEHPQDPNGLDVYIRSDASEEHWDRVKLPPMAVSTIREELAGIAAHPNEYYWCHLTVVTSTPMNEDSRVSDEQDEANGPDEA